MTELHGFKLVEERHIAEVNSNAKLYQHIKTGAELLSLENDDENKSFMVTLVTPPSDDTGIAHILEHSVLAGSKKYPVKEPFVQLLKTSVNTFLNAMTSSDMTMYPVASTNLQDFYNLVDVYMDAVFFPLINEQTFMQEGWHLEAEDESAALSYKGVVFNEMKAAFSAPDTYMNFITDRTLWTDSPYKYSSGGLPAAITDLTYEQFKNFHETYYHPSNARFVFSGNDDAETRLRLVDEIISQFDARAVDSEIALQTPFSEPITVIEGYDAGETPQNGNGTMVSVNWLLPEQNDSDLIYDLSLLSHALVSTSASPLRKALIDSGLGEGLTGSGLGTSSRQATFAVGLKGVKEEDAEKVSAFIMETLGNIAEEGIDKETVKASLNTIEFNMRERNYGSFPRGLANAMIAMRPWIYGGNPLDTLSFDADFEALKQRIANDEDYLETLIGKYLLDNSHRATVIMKPDETVGTERDEAERNRLDKTKETLNTDDIKHLIEVQNDLLTLQQTPDDPAELAKIPTLKLEDIERKVSTTEQEIIEQDGTRIYFHNQPTGGIVYFQAGMNLRTVPADLLPYVELFGESLTRMGTTGEDFVRLTQRIGSKTGGVGASTSLSTKRDGSDYVAYLMVGGKTMHDQSQDLLSIIQDILLTVNLDNQSRFKQIVLERKVRAERFVNYAGHAVASGRIRAQLTETAWASDILSGTEHLFFLRDLVEKVDSDWDSVLASLEAVRDLLVNHEQMVVNVTMEATHWANFKSQLDTFLTALPKKSLKTAQWSTADTVPYEALTLPAQVSFNAKAANLYDLGYELDGSISVITKHLSREYIWQHIRVMGGAYGGNISFSPSSGIIGYLSWRDPNISKTLTTFNGTADYLINLEMSAEDVEKAVIGAIGGLDSYDLPDAKGRKAFMRHLLGYTDEMRQAYRDQVLDTTIDDFRQFGEILAKISDDQARFATVTSADFVPTASEEIGIEFKVTKLQ